MLLAKEIRTPLLTLALTLRTCKTILIHKAKNVLTSPFKSLIPTLLIGLMATASARAGGLSPNKYFQQALIAMGFTDPTHQQTIYEGVGYNVDPDHAMEVYTWLVKEKVAKPRSLVLRFPQILALSIDSNIKPKLAYLKAHGIEKPIQAVSLSPQILGYDLPAKLPPRIQWLKTLEVKKPEEVIQAVPGILGLDIKSNLEAKVLWLRSIGIIDVAKVIKSNPGFLTRGIDETLEPKRQWLIRIGVKDSTGVIQRYPQLLTLSIEGNLEPKLKWLSERGFTDPVAVFETYPNLMGYGLEGNIQPTFEFLVDQLKIPLEDLARAPMTLTGSLPRMQRLAAFFKALRIDPSDLSLAHKIALAKSLNVEHLIHNFYALNPPKTPAASFSDMTAMERKLMRAYFLDESFHSKLFRVPREGQIPELKRAVRSRHVQTTGVNTAAANHPHIRTPRTPQTCQNLFLKLNGSAF